MMLLLAILLCLLAVFSICIMVLLKSTLSVRVTILISTDRMETEIALFFWKKELGSFKINEKKLKALIKERAPDRSGKDVRDAFQPFHDLYRLCRLAVKVIRSLNLSEKVCLNDFSWKTSCGLGEARATAMTCGIIWSVKYSVMPLIGNMMSDRPLIEVAPLFQEKVFTTRLSCMITVKTGEAMLIMRQIKRQVKEGECNGGSSHSGFDENSAGKSSVHDRRRNDYRRSD
ncbi:DUF2953 domain-containing protein [Sporolactobacillus putidus]|uniref:DUF2953 domain-containing protein n=1 Tax=Sporolactobacillus putidus TaxID=492735 RepID=UPI001666D322|nr:DUF2953 domain-containing protein [Sporolactobacillus putidus]